MPERKKQQKKSVTLRVVAKQANVSIKTVSNVLNDWPYVSDETRGKVQSAIDALGYRPNALATSLRTGRTNTIGVLIPDNTNPFFGQIVRGCEDVLCAAGYSIFLCNTNEDLAKEYSYLDTLVRRGVDGLLMFGTRSTRDVLATVVRDEIPIVAEDPPSPDRNTTVLAIENMRGAELATQHLITHGHTRIAHLAGPEERPAGKDRRDGYRQALAQVGLFYDPALVLHGSPSIRSGYSAALALLKTTSATALFCFNDLMAVDAMLACKELGLAIPRDIAIVGFDDIVMSSLVVPALTTIRVAQYEMGRRAAELLVQRMAGDEAPQHTVVIPVELVVRASCGAHTMVAPQLEVTLEDLLKADLR